MTRIARVVVPRIPHHATQHGNRRQKIYFGDADNQAYLDLLGEWWKPGGLAVRADCLMPNRVHLVVVPKHEDRLRAGLAAAHRRYTRRINGRKKWRGHLRQVRFHSFAMDDLHVCEAVRYVELNPVRAKLARRPEDWRWSSARARRTRRPDPVRTTPAAVKHHGDWRSYLGTRRDERRRQNVCTLLRRHSRTGRPLGSDRFIARLAGLTGHALRPQSPGPNPKTSATQARADKRVGRIKDTVPRFVCVPRFV